jgi:hypothetical protein
MTGALIQSSMPVAYRFHEYKMPAETLDRSILWPINPRQGLAAIIGPCLDLIPMPGS